VPASGYFEWTGEVGNKQPYFIHDPADELLLFAGLWSRWKSSGDADWLHTFAIVTGEPGRVSGDVHDRQPVILPPDSWEEWLTDEVEIAADILRHAPHAELACHPVTRAVGSPRNQGAEIIQPIEL
jgi:putative SOS response-associated peptidase YedK